MKKQNYRKRADALIQLIGVANNSTCLVCGNRCEVMHHYIKKSQSTKLRYCWDNLVPLCNSCHCKHHVTGDPRIVEIILQKKGQAWADNLHAHKTGGKSTEAFFREMYEMLLLMSVDIPMD